MSVAFQTDTGEIVDELPEESKRPSRKEIREAYSARAWRRVTYFLLFLLAVAIYLIVTLPITVPRETHIPLSAFPACETEDSDNCAWIGSDRGNEVGRSYVTIDGVQYFAPVN